MTSACCLHNFVINAMNYFLCPFYNPSARTAAQKTQLFSCYVRLLGNAFTRLFHSKGCTGHILYHVKVKVKVTLRLAVYRQSVRIGDKPLETHDQIIFSTELLRQYSLCSILSDEKMGLSLTNMLGISSSVHFTHIAFQQFLHCCLRTLLSDGSGFVACLHSSCPGMVFLLCFTIPASRIYATIF
jgi:hypothetical protein